MDPILEEIMNQTKNNEEDNEDKNIKDKLGQFISNPQNLNSYSYVTNNPLKYIDPTGKIKVHSEEATKEQIEKFNEALKDAKAQVEKNSVLREYFELFDVDIAKILSNNNEGPDVYIGINGSSPGRYNTLTNNIGITDLAFEGINSYSIDKYLIHEIAHWANDVASAFGNLNPNTSGFKKANETLDFFIKNDEKFAKNVEKDGVYGYLTEMMWK